VAAAAMWSARTQSAMGSWAASAKVGIILLFDDVPSIVAAGFGRQEGRSGAGAVRFLIAATYVRSGMTGGRWSPFDPRKEGVAAAKSDDPGTPRRRAPRADHRSAGAPGGISRRSGPVR